jgi:hypothetical protein
VTTVLPPLVSAIFRDGKFSRFTTLDDPRGGYCRAFNSYAIGAIAVPWTEELEFRPADHPAVTYAVVSVPSIKVLKNGLTREEADGFAFGYNGEAVAKGDKKHRAAVMLTDDLPTAGKAGAA